MITCTTFSLLTIVSVSECRVNTLQNILSNHDYMHDIFLI